MPFECDHGKILDWGDFGPDPDDGSVGVERCTQCDGDTPDRRTVIGPFYVDLWRGLLRDEIRVWRDVRPALGGLISRRTCWRRQSDEVYDRIVAVVTNAAP